MTAQPSASGAGLSAVWLLPLAFGCWLVYTSLTGGLGPFGVYDAKRLLQLGLLPAVAALALLHRPLRTEVGALLRALPAPVVIMFAGFLSLGLLSAARLSQPAYSLVEVGMLFLLVVAALCVAGAQRLAPTAFERIALGSIAVLGLGVFAQEALAVLVYLSQGQQYNYREALIYFLHPRMYNHLQTWTLLLLPLLPLVFGDTRGWRTLCVFLIGCQWFLVLATGARGSTVSLLGAMLLGALLFRRDRGTWLKPQIFGILAGVLLFTAVSVAMERAVPGESRFISESVGRPMLHTSGRLDLWQHALEDAQRNPLLGAGPMRYACEVDHYLAASPHNFPLQILGEWGVPAFLLLGGLFGWLVSRWIPRARALQGHAGPASPRVTCLSSACIAAAIHLGASGLMIAPASQVAGVLVTGWLVGLAAPRSAARSPVPGGMAVIVLALALACGSALLAFGVREQAQMETRAAYARDYGPITPRFWQDGKVCLFDYSDD